MPLPLHSSLGLDHCHHHHHYFRRLCDLIHHCPVSSLDVCHLDITYDLFSSWNNYIFLSNHLVWWLYFQVETTLDIPQQPSCPMVGGEESLEASGCWKREEVSFQLKSTMWRCSLSCVLMLLLLYNWYQSSEQYDEAELMYFTGTAEAWQLSKRCLTNKYKSGMGHGLWGNVTVNRHISTRCNPFGQKDEIGVNSGEQFKAFSSV